jgi:NIMA (never in mitosis gene a)-related kinase
MEVYEDIKSVGRGTFAEARLCRRREDGKLFVQKQFFTPQSELLPQERAALRNEVRMLEHLRHPSIVAFHDFVVDADGIAHLIMEHCPGGTLEGAIKAGGGQPLREEAVLEAFVQLADVLRFCHRACIMHRDIKSSNIFLSGPAPEFRVLKLGDFGIARFLGAGDSGLATTIVGTPFYVSPEVALGQPYAYGADVYSLGCILYELLSEWFTSS